MLKFFRIPFALSGDKAAIPDTVDAVAGSVSYPEGFGFNYQRDFATDPLALNIPRDKSNQLYYDITAALAELQAQGVPDFITSALNGGTAYSYSQYAVVKWSGDLYISLVAANTALPSDATKWALLPTPGRIQQGTYISAVATGTADAILGAFSPAIAALPSAPDTLSVVVRASAVNTSLAPTFKADGTAAKSIVKGANRPLVAGDISGAGHWLILQYDPTLDKWILQNPATGVSSGGYMLVRDEKAAGTSGGTSSAATIITRTLNTIVVNTIVGASLASNRVTLPAGTYRVKATTTGYDLDRNKGWLYNVTDSTYAAIGDAGDAATSGDSRSLIVGYFTISAPKTFELQMYSHVATTNGLGFPANVAGVAEVYSTLEIVKEP